MDGADRVSKKPAPIIALAVPLPTMISRTNGRIECMFVTGFLTNSGKHVYTVFKEMLRSSLIMRRDRLLLFSLILLCLSPRSNAQSWTGILDPTRAIDWSKAGVAGGIPNRSTVCATLNPGATSAQIISAINACPSGQVVFLNAGNYTNLSGMSVTRSNVTLRGAGADQTKLFFTGTAGACGAWGANMSICISDGTSNGGFGPTHTATFTIPGTPANSQGVTQIVLSSTTGLAVGSLLTLDQVNDATGTGYPVANDIYVCATTSCTSEGGGEYGRSGRDLLQTVTVTNISGNTVTFVPGLYMPSWRASQSPGAWWGSSQISGFGIENLSIDLSGNGQNHGIWFTNAVNCWLKGIRQVVPSQLNGGNQFTQVNLVVPAAHLTIRDSYFYGSFDNASTQYGISAGGASDALIENNITENINSPIMENGADTGSVYGYNFGRWNWYTPTFEQHNSGEFMNLVEGMDGSGVWSDNIHGTGGFTTFFRNHLHGDSGVETPQRAPTAFIINGYHRFINIIGNVSGASFYTTYQTTNIDNIGNEIYALDYHYNGPEPDDARTLATLMRWGNWDSLTSTNKTGTNDSTGTRFVSSEVPSGLLSYANALPALQVLPASFYLASRPSWWSTPYGTPPWPPIGPDVANGNINTTATPTGGHANKIPARLCWENAALDPAYGSTNPRVRSFNAATCYASGTASPPAAPTNLKVVVQ